jgi:enolase
MQIKEVKARAVRDSRGEKTIAVSVNGCVTIAPSGKSVGKYEAAPYALSLEEDIKIINGLEIHTDISKFSDLDRIEKFLGNKIGANTLYAFEASIMKALARESGKELWQVLNPSLNARVAKFPRVLSNTIGGGVHSIGKEKPDFQEFLFVCNAEPSRALEINTLAYEEARQILKTLSSEETRKNDETAWMTNLGNEQVLEVMKDVQENIFESMGVHIDIGIDIASSQFFKHNSYDYNNPGKVRDRKKQIFYIADLIKKYNLFYVEDPLDEEDFKGHAELLEEVRRKCLIVGDDLTTTNPARLLEAIKRRAISGIIIKPNQIGSLLQVYKVIELAKKNKIYTIISHRSGESVDDTIADIAFAWQTDFIKTPVIGKERIAKVKRLVEIENSIITKNKIEKK